MDKLTKEQRHKNMQAIRSRDTKIEILLRKALWHEGIRYRKNYKVCSCHPDIVITKYRIAVFCDGEFWHGKSLERYDVATNVKFWHEKIKRNVERDLENTIELRDNGWIVLRVLPNCGRTPYFYLTQYIFTQTKRPEVRKSTYVRSFFVL